MAQNIYPIADLFQTNTTFPQGWYNGFTGLGGGGDLWTRVDDSPILESDAGGYIAVHAAASQSTDHVVGFDLGDVLKPRTEQGWTFWVTGNYLVDANPGGNGLLTLELRQGYVSDSSPGKLIYKAEASDSGFEPTTLSSPVTSEQTFAMGIAWDTGLFTSLGSGLKGITNFKDLQVRVIFNQSSASGFQIFRINLQAADQPWQDITTSIIPVSPIYGEVKVAGSVNGPPFVQLLNPTTSPFKLQVYEIYIWGGGDNGGIGSEGRKPFNYARRSNQPFGLGAGGTLTLGNQIRLDPANGETIWGIFQAFNFWNAQFHGPDAPNGNGWLEFEDPARWGIDCQWGLRPDPLSALDEPTHIRPAGGHPWTVMPGSAIEILWMSTANSLRVGVVYDQKLLTL
jgi:hypothetical protein